MTIKGLPPVAIAGIVALVFADACLAVLIGLQLRGEPPKIAAAGWKSESKQQLPPKRGGRALENYRETLLHPVFFKTRGPYEPPPARDKAAPAAASAADAGVSIGGVAISFDIKKAYLFSKSSPRGIWVGEGEPYQGWTLKTVDQRGVVLQQDNRSIEVLLYPGP